MRISLNSNKRTFLTAIIFSYFTLTSSNAYSQQVCEGESFAIDGKTSDWQGITPVTEYAEFLEQEYSGLRLSSIKLAVDSDYYYFLLERDGEDIVQGERNSIFLTINEHYSQRLTVQHKVNIELFSDAEPRANYDYDTDPETAISLPIALEGKNIELAIPVSVFPENLIAVIGYFSQAGNSGAFLNPNHGQVLPLKDRAVRVNLAAPSLTLFTSGNRVGLDWVSVVDATVYDLFYAPYPDAAPISSLEMVNNNPICLNLDSGTSLYVAVRARNSCAEGQLSNIVTFSLTGEGSTQSTIDISKATSHELQNPNFWVSRYGIRQTTNAKIVNAPAYGDFNGDGFTDVLLPPNDNAQASLDDPVPVEMYLNNGCNTFTYAPDFFGESTPASVLTRKSITGDYNRDGMLDIFLLDTGVDLPPYAGAKNVMIMSSENGYFVDPAFENDIGYSHGGASADIDNDGDLDILVANFQSFFYINDGAGNFSIDENRFPSGNVQAFTHELIDIDGDGYVDVLAGGHEYQSTPTQILWGNENGLFQESLVLPKRSTLGIVLDFDAADIDGDSDMDLVVTRTADGTGEAAWYAGYSFQILENVGGRAFNDVTSTHISDGTDLVHAWVEWARLRDLNGDGAVDLFVDDAGTGLVWYNDGNGVFSKQVP